MSLVALDGTPLVKIGSILSAAQNSQWAAGNILQDAAKEACIMYGQVTTDDGLSHTIDTTGSSSLQWRTGSVTFANAGTTLKVGLATMDTATGPAARATNVSDVITLSVSKSMAGNGGLVAANAWQTHVPDAGSLSVANGDFIAFCTQMTAVGGADLVNTTIGSVSNTPQRPSVTAYTGGAYAASASVPNCIIVFSDGHLGWFGGATVFSTLTNLVWNSGSATKEYGNYLKFPFPLNVYGIYCVYQPSADCDFILYSDPLGTPVAAKTVSVDSNAVAVSGTREAYMLFAAPYTATASQPLAAIAKPGASNVTITYRSMNAAAHQAADHCGTNGYGVSRASGSFAAVNSNKDRFPIGLLVGAFSQENNQLINSASLVG